MRNAQIGSVIVAATMVTTGENKIPQIRYSDQDLKEFKEIVLKKLEKAKADLACFEESSSNQNGTDDTSFTFKEVEEGCNNQIKDESSKKIDRQREFIQKLEAALFRIENKTYGICRETGKLIPKERLRAVPHATLTVEAKEERDKSQR